MALNIILIDDNVIDLFINQKMIERAGVLSNFKTFSDADSAINYLKKLEDSSCCNVLNVPDIIFLDINMPIMDGFQFINKFKKLKIKKENPIKIYMLSSSANPVDEQKVKQEKLCSGLLRKPLTNVTINNVMVECKLC